MSYTLTNTINLGVYLSTDGSVHASDNVNVIVAAKALTFSYISTNSGATFTQVTQFSQMFQAPNISSDGSFMVGSNKTNIYVSTNTGASWTSVLGGLNNPYFVSCSSTGQYLVTIQDYITAAYVSSNYGKSWNTATVPQTSWQGIFVTRSGQYMLLSGNAGVYLSSNFGVSFTTISAYNNYTVYSAVCSEDGKRITLAPGFLNVVKSSDGGVTWSLAFPSTIRYTLSCSTNGLNVIATPFYSSGTAYITKNQFNTYTTITAGQSMGNWMSSDGTYALRTDSNSTNSTTSIYVYQFILPTIIVDGTTVAINGTYTAIARTKSVNVVVIPPGGQTVLSITGTTVVEDLNTITITMSDNSVYLVYVMVLRNCFKEDTKILCYVDNKEQYIPVQELRRGTLVKTQVNGYVPIHTIGHSKIYNSDNKLRSMNRLFKCTKENYPEITEDLIMTGCHGILVDEEDITMEVRRKTKELTRDDVWQTGKKFRMLTCIDERAEPYEEEGTFPIWHFALDHYDRFMNYGVYANGLLVESCDINTINEFSGLELV